MIPHPNHGHDVPLHNHGHHPGPTVPDTHVPDTQVHGSHDPRTLAGEAAMAEVLELDASLAGGYAQEAAAWAAGLARGPVREVADLGAGTGTGILALAQRFPEAALTAVDLSPAMLRRLRDAAGRAGVGDRLRTVEADLDTGWTGATEALEGGVDLAWASSSLHHVRDPDRVLRHILRTLRPGGLFLVLELDDLPRFLAGAGGALADLEERCHQSVGPLGWNSHPDWSDALVRAGFEPEGRRILEVEACGPDGSGPSGLVRFARLFLARIRAALESGAGAQGGIAAEDLYALDRLLGQGPGSLEELPGLSVRTRRTAWAARRPDRAA